MYVRGVVCSSFHFCASRQVLSVSVYSLTSSTTNAARHGDKSNSTPGSLASGCQVTSLELSHLFSKNDKSLPPPPQSKSHRMQPLLCHASQTIFTPVFCQRQRARSATPPRERRRYRSRAPPLFAADRRAADHDMLASFPLQALAPLVERNQPSPEICSFFIKVSGLAGKQPILSPVALCQQARN